MRVNPNPLRLDITGRKHLSVIWRHVARINRLDKLYLAECELRIINQLDLASSIQRSNCRCILEIPLLILCNPKFWRNQRNYSIIVFAYNKTFFHGCKIFLFFFVAQGFLKFIFSQNDNFKKWWKPYTTFPHILYLSVFTIVNKGATLYSKTRPTKQNQIWQILALVHV